MRFAPRALNGPVYLGLCRSDELETKLLEDIELQVKEE